MRGLVDFGFKRTTCIDRLPASWISKNQIRRDRLTGCSLAVAGMIALSIPHAVDAQTCVAPLPWPTDATSINGNTCFGSRIAEALCGGEVANPGLNVIYRIYVSGNASEINSMGFTLSPVMYLSDETHDCSSSPCLRSGSWISLTGLAPGYYQLIVAHSDFDAAGACGQFTLAADAPLSETDVYFENGFD